MRNLIPIAAAALLALPAGAAPQAAVESEQDRVIYAFGMALSSTLRGVELDEHETEILVQGLYDQLLGRPLEIDPKNYMPKVAKFVAARVESGLAKERAASGKFLAKAAARPGAVTTESGLVYLETKAGSGPAPGPEDSVKVHYHGTRNDGSVFDSSRERGAPAVFSLQGVIPCWTEALQRMKVGGTATIACPAHLAYGDQGTNTIKAAAALQFEIELIGVE